MAAIDDLVARVSDSRLRDQIAEQVRRLVDRTEFGLVFQDHLPEAVEMPSLPVQVGSAVRERGGSGDILRVVSLGEGRAELEQAYSPEGISRDPSIWVDVDSIVVVKDFREPVYAGLRPLVSFPLGASKPSQVVIQGENFLRVGDFDLHPRGQG